MTGQRPAGWLVDLSLVAVSLIWGATFVLVKQALADVSTVLFLTLRFAIAAAVLGIVFQKEFDTATLRRSLPGGLAAGLFLFGGYVLQTFGLKFTSASKAGFLTGLYVPLVPLFSSLVYHKLPQFAELLGVAAAFTGVMFLTMQRDVLAIGLGDLLVIGCAVAYAFHILILGRYAAASSIPVLTIGQIATGAVLGAGTFWWTEPVRLRWTVGVGVALAVTSLLATAFAFSVQTWAQRWSSPTRTALIFSLEPVFAWATSYVVAGEVLSRRGMAGAALIVAGILLAELKPFRLRPHPSG
jgi:drug/metabolite transporter (DMT)-like permease